MTTGSALEQRVPALRRLARGEQLILALSIAAGEIGARVEAVLRAREPLLTHSRYNALRMLRGAGASGLPCSEVGARLLLSPSTVTRLMDPLVEHGFVARASDPTDRRVSVQRITRKGGALLAHLDHDLAAVYDAVTRALPPKLVGQLITGSDRLITVAQGLVDPEQSGARVAQAAPARRPT